MRSLFTLFNTPIDLGHKFFSSLLKEGDIAIDATCGKGRDSLALAKLLSEKNGSSLLCIDIQEIAVQSTEELLKKELPSFLPSVTFQRGSHESFSELFKGGVKLAVYNLGYMPGGDKTLTTTVSSTLKSVKNAMRLLTPGGVINITCYPGHPEGAKEEAELTSLLSSLEPSLWSFTSIRWNNRRASPSLLLLQKSLEVRENL